MSRHLSKFRALFRLLFIKWRFNFSLSFLDKLITEDKASENNDFAYENLNETYHLIEDSEFRDNNVDGADIFQSESDSSDEVGR